MKYTMRPVISSGELEEALRQRYPGEEAFENGFECASFLWPEDFYNDSYKNLRFRNNGMPIEYDEAEDEENRQYNLIFAFLCEVFPTFDSVLVDVSW